MFNIKEELKKLPDKPGVYLMYNKSDEVIYVGKAINLKNRVRQYFQNGRNLTSKIQKMVSLIEYFEYIITNSELEALILECNLIKEYKPKYNTLLKDDKSFYPYIKVTISEEYPRILSVRTIKRDKDKYFGPYKSSKAVNDTIELLRKVYNIRNCNKFMDKYNGRACIYYDMKQCKAPCKNLISKEEYAKQIKSALKFLNGDSLELINMLEDKMQIASDELNFEKAMEYRDLIQNVKQIVEKQKINTSDLDERDILAVAKSEKQAVAVIFFVRDGKLVGREHFYMKQSEECSKSEILLSFLKQFYSGTPFIPKNILLSEDIEEKDIIQEWLSNRKEQKVYISVPKKGDKHKIVELAEENAFDILQKDLEKLQKEERRTIGAVQEITKLININYPKRIEAYDISNFSGFETVASMVVFEDGKPKRSDYRKFKIKTVKGQDDYKSMQEVLTRRFLAGKNELISNSENSFNKLPDLIMMDGGKGQVNIALNVLKKLSLNIKVCGMVKDGNHNTRGLYYNNEEIDINKNSEAFKLITRIQDEAHRFAIEYQKLLRGKAQVKSVLDDIKGVGDVKRKILMKHFKGVENIKNASIEELLKVNGISKSLAEEIWKYFH